MVKNYYYFFFLEKRVTLQLICGVKNRRPCHAAAPNFDIAIKLSFFSQLSFLDTLYLFYFIMLFSFSELGRSQTHCAAKDVLKVLCSASTSQVLGLQACTPPLHLHGAEAQTQAFVFTKQGLWQMSYNHHHHPQHHKMQF